MRRFSDNEKLNAAVAGATSALSLLVDAKDRRIFFALVFFARSFVSFHPLNNTSTAGHTTEHASEEGTVPQILVWRGHYLGPDGLLHQVLHVMRARVPQ
jgi:hypothetical protein